MLEKQSSGSQSGNHSVLFFSFLFFPPLNGQPARQREREGEMDGWMDGQMIDSWMDWEVKLTMAGGCSNLTLFLLPNFVIPWTL